MTAESAEFDFFLCVLGRLCGEKSFAAREEFAGKLTGIASLASCVA